ncbi:hypothetical protein GCM10027413_29470 [Conyzicola nivalis]|uniref:Uncharacterized protein n=1 Tax=Conyzicola nivalis TaxID=1477021 RepID=A0A916SSH5_9MICO|nr:hypothetical protein GCM10010979_30040 [Conyzicola nivalis]
MASDPGDRTAAWAQIGLAVFTEGMGVWALVADPGGTSARGLPMWLLGGLLVVFGVWVAARAIKTLRRTS